MNGVVNGHHDDDGSIGNLRLGKETGDLHLPQPLFAVKRNIGGVFGQFLEAIEDIPKGSVVLEEPCAFWGPSADYVEDYSTPICCGCAVVMNDGNNENGRCDRCGWPLCSPSCDNVKYHEAFECELFAREKVPFPPTQNFPIQHTYKGLTIVRGLLLKQKDPELWTKVMNLQWINEIQDSVSPDFTSFQRDFGLPGFSSPEEWARVLGILNVNSYSIQRIEKKAGSPSFAEFIYPFQCLMNHSCVPNCNWAIAYSPSFVIRATAAVDIKRGDMLTVAYNLDLSKYGTGVRQQKIRNQAKFSCKCERCKDPTDFGTFAGGVRCFKKCNINQKEGYLLPQDSLDPESMWKCSECQYKTDSSFISSFVQSLYEQVEMATLLEEAGESDDDDESPVDLLEEFIAEKSGSVLHPNHWVLTAASRSIVQELSSHLESLDIQELDQLIAHTERLLTLRQKIIPGICTEKGILQHYLARGKFRRAEFAVACKSLSEPDEIETEMRKVYEIQKCALLFWRQNPHYGSLHANYKGDAELLAQEMQRVKSKLYSLE